MSKLPHAIVRPPAGRPCWVSHGNLPLLYLGWGKRDFHKSPLPRHCDAGTSFYLLTKGEALLATAKGEQRIIAPCACLIDRDCMFGISNKRATGVEILVWVWRDAPGSDSLTPLAGDLSVRPLRSESLPRLIELHQQCRDEVARNEPDVSVTLSALRTLVEVELLRAGRAPENEDRRLWQRVSDWISANLSIHAPIPALCDYLRVSPSTLTRFFKKHTKQSPGVYFRKMKQQEALRLIQSEGWSVKAAAFHLGYRHATDLSRALAKAAPPPPGLT
ncbi:MAG: AraC family transcriptional regulator [Verrucomicrobia bacterium]|nr:AraC family transcriptional regulator [Verrucomicrobiota bacterium]